MPNKHCLIRTSKERSPPLCLVQSLKGARDRPVDGNLLLVKIVSNAQRNFPGPN